MKKFLIPFLTLLVISVYANNLLACIDYNLSNSSTFFCLIQSESKCNRCKGTGEIPCPVCNGTGISGWTTVHGQRAAYGCENCGGIKGNPVQGTGLQGKGKIKCPDCNGTGKSKTPNKTIQPPPLNNSNDNEKALAEKQKQEQAEIKRKQEEFEKSKQEALKSMKGISDNELGLKGVTSDNKLGLKGVENRTELNLRERVDANVVDLRHLDPNKPITVDPNVVKGKDRVFPVQPDPSTFENENYKKGFEALRNFDPVTALSYFEIAKKERPNDPLVNNALLLSQDLVKVFLKNEQRKKDQAVIWKDRAYLALMSEEPGTSFSYLTHALDLDPKNAEIKEQLDVTQKISILFLGKKPDTPLEDRVALRIALSSGHLIVKKNYSTAISFLETAQNISPGNEDIKKIISWVKQLQKKQTNSNTKKVK